METNHLEKLLDEQEAAPYVGVRRKTLANWRVEGVGPKFLRVGGRVRYHPRDISEWLDGRRVQSTSELSKVA